MVGDWNPGNEYLHPLNTNSEDDRLQDFFEESSVSDEASRIDQKDEYSQRTKIVISVFEIYSSGFCCAKCNVSVGLTVEAVRRHLKREIHSDLLPGIGNIAKLHADMTDARESLSRATGDKCVTTASSPTETRLKCLICNRSYGERHNFFLHVRRSNGHCVGSHPIPTAYAKMECGRLVEAESSVPLVSKLDAMAAQGQSSFSSAELQLTKFIRDDEDIGPFVSMFSPLLQLHPSLESTIHNNINHYSTAVSKDEPMLITLLEMAKSWLDGARHEVALVPGNHRAKLLQFKEQDIGGVSQNLTFNFRHRTKTLLPELNKFLVFVWRSQPKHIVAFIKRSVANKDPYVVARILTYYFHEEPRTYHNHPVIVQFTLSRFFRKCANGSLQMHGAGQNASLAAVVLSLLRTGICSFICSYEYPNIFSPQIILRSQECRTANILSPFIRRLREMERRKKKKRMVSVDETGMIAVDGFEIEKELWSSTISLILARCEALLKEVIAGNDWHSVLDLTNHVSVDADFSFSIKQPDGSHFTPNFALKENFDITILDCLSSLMELSFHGLGLGSLRYAELERMEISRCIWHRSTVYFDVYTEKVFSSQTKSKLSSQLPVEHKLPPSIARVFLLFRKIVLPLVSFRSPMAVPTREASKHTMCHAMAEIFGFSEVPDAVQVRQFWASILNIVFPGGDLSGALCAAKPVAETHGHAAETHMLRYSTLFTGGKEYLYRIFHTAIGEKPAGVVDSNLVIRPVDLTLALRLLIGPEASYTSPHQQQLVEFAAFSTLEHAHGDLPCGAGKSMAWLLPLAARLLSGRRAASGNCTFVVSPYKFLSAFQMEATSAFLQKHTDPWIVSYNASDFRGRKFPNELSLADILPDVVFITIDALAAFLEDHKPVLSRLCRNGLIQRFILDEIHTLLTEGFRPVYESLSLLPAFGVPILTLSGSLPREFRSSLLSYIGMSTSLTGYGEVKLIGGGDVLGPFPSDFKFSCMASTNPRKLTIRTALDAIRRNSSHAVHIMVSSKEDAAFIATKISEASISHRLLTSDLEEAQQKVIAKQWRKSKFSVLVSTTLAVTGNENPSCRHLVVNGYLFNIITTVQAINRLRPRQRFGGASIRIFLPRRSLSFFEDKWESEERLVFASLVGRGLVPDDADLWKLFGSRVGLHQWLVIEGGCWIANLSAKFGTPRNPCKMCERCNDNPICRAAEANLTNVNQTVKTQNVAMNVIRRLEQMCIVCKSQDCNGEQCLPSGSCFKCGGPHYRNACKTNWQGLLNGKGCFFCLDLFHRQGYNAHNAHEEGCPLKRRLKRLVIQKFETSGQACIDEFYAKISSDMSNFYAFLASTVKK